jgi:hypothetical protein
LSAGHKGYTAGAGEQRWQERDAGRVRDIEV